MFGMNRIIIIGNGFDKAHSLKTGYKDFIDSYWRNVLNTIHGGYDRWLSETYGGDKRIRPFEDEFIIFKFVNGKIYSQKDKNSATNYPNPYGELCKLIAELNDKDNPSGTFEIEFKNDFLEIISARCSLTNWVDIENEYYNRLTELLVWEDSEKRPEKIKNLNKNFGAVREFLEKYLIDTTKNINIKAHQSIQDAFSSSIDLEDIAHRKQKAFLNSILSEIHQFNNAPDFLDEVAKEPSYQHYSDEEANRQHVLVSLKNNSFKRSYCAPNRTLILNFNYTKTAENLYINEKNFEVINIHGELNNPQNPIIFGYGDELDDDYKKIEKLQDNNFLENIKSIHYHKTRNYKNLLSFIESGLYQVFVMGHSCGNSDRTLLNTLFENENCASVKVFYRQFEDGSDDHNNLIKNISRNFNDKSRMRDVVVNWEECSPLVPVTTE